MQCAEAEVAAGDKRAHGEVIGHYQGCTVAIYRRLGVEGVVMRGDLAELGEEGTGNALSLRC